jgi:hypothetical protein
MSDTPSPLNLPALQQTLLDPPTLAALFRDLAACTQIAAVLPKFAGQSAHAHTGSATITLDAAREGLADGTLRGAQIRYRYQDQVWCDTLMARPDGIRLVRICEDDIAATLEPKD